MVTRQENVKINGRDVLKQYFEDKEKAERTIAILQVPTMVLLALFIFMVAAKMLDTYLSRYPYRQAFPAHKLHKGIGISYKKCHKAG